MPFFSIITINYNNLDGLRRTVCSVVEQSFSDYEFIIIDGNSSDGSQHFCEEINDTRIKYISENDRGIYDAINKGVGIATGEVIQLLHSGDVFCSSNTLEKINLSFMQHNDLALYGNVKFTDYMNNLKVIKRIWRPGKFVRGKYYLGWMIPHLGLSVKRDIYLEYGNYDTRLRIAADYEWMLKIFFKNRIVPRYIDLDIVYMERGGVSNANILQVIKGNIEVIKSWWINGYMIIPIWIFIVKPLSKFLQFSRCNKNISSKFEMWKR